MSEFLAAHGDAAVTIALYVVAQVVTVGILRNDIGWIKSQARHHAANDATQFAALTSRVDTLILAGAKNHE